MEVYVGWGWSLVANFQCGQLAISIFPKGWRPVLTQVSNKKAYELVMQCLEPTTLLSGTVHDEGSLPQHGPV